MASDEERKGKEAESLRNAVRKSPGSWDFGPLGHVEDREKLASPNPSVFLQSLLKPIQTNARQTELVEKIREFIKNYASTLNDYANCLEARIVAQKATKANLSYSLNPIKHYLKDLTKAKCLILKTINDFREIADGSDPMLSERTLNEWAGSKKLSTDVLSAIGYAFTTHNDLYIEGKENHKLRESLKPCYSELLLVTELLGKNTKKSAAI